MRSLSIVEAAAAASVAASAACVMVPAFTRNLHASRLAEPMDGLERIASRALALGGRRPVDVAFPGPAPQTPALVPRGELVVDLPGTWDHSTWLDLDFKPDQPHAFAFTFESDNGADSSHFRATAHGDLDGDGSQSTFSVSGEVRRGEAPVVHPIEITREIE